MRTRQGLLDQKRKFKSTHTKHGCSSMDQRAEPSRSNSPCVQSLCAQGRGMKRMKQVYASHKAACMKESFPGRHGKVQ
eukprot:scaffold134300_cov14-Tisochrysis_lutea.AAC.1